MADSLAELPISTLDTGVTSNLWTSDPGINVASNESLLGQIASFASNIGSTVSGVLNNVRYGTGPGGVTPVAAQPQAVAGSLGIGTILLLAVGAYFILGRK